MDNRALVKADEWIKEKYDETTSDQLQDWINYNESQLLQNAFDDSLAIGYDGWRTIVGPGLGYFNKFSISRITQALVNYLRKAYPGERIKIALAYDGRKESNLYAQEVGKVISSNDHLAYYFPFVFHQGCFRFL